MFRSGAENMFIGDSGAVTYLFLVMLTAVVSIGLAATMRKGFSARKLGPLVRGMVLAALARFLHFSQIAGESEEFSFLSVFLALAGFYYMFVFASSGRRSAGIPSPSKMVLLPAAGTALVIGLPVFAFAQSKVAGSPGLALASLAAVFSLPGMMAGLVSKYKTSRCGGPFFFSASMAFLAASTGMLGLSVVSFPGKDPFWLQLFSILDISGFFMYMMSIAFGAVSEMNEEARTGMGEDGNSPRAVAFVETPQPGERDGTDICRMILRGDREQDIYRNIAKLSAEKTGADFVLIRMLNPEDEKFSLKGYAGSAGGDGMPQLATAVSKSKLLKLCGGGVQPSGTYLFDREGLGEDAEAFVPMSIEWKAGALVIHTVMEKDKLKGFFTAGFFRDGLPDGAAAVFGDHGENVVKLEERESMRERTRKAERSLSLCREELEAANQLKSNFLSIVSHELRTPLTSIKAYSETLMDNVRTIDRETIGNFLKVMGEENDRVIKLVDNILNYSSMETGHLKVEKVSCNLNLIISETMEEMDADFIARKVNRDVKVPKKEVFIDADRELIKQLVRNLVSNAVKFTPEMGKVTVTLAEEASAARITVQDTGRGVPEDQLEKIFERFHQVDESDTREYGGSGLGLAICKNIVEWHDGKIWVENVMEAGARFVVMLPMKDIVIRQAATAGRIGSVRFERERYLSLLVEMVSEFLQAKKSSIMMLDRRKQYLHVVAAKGLDPEFVQNTRVELGERIAGKVFVDGESVYVFDIERDRNVHRANNSAYYGTNSFISSPMRDGDEVIGVLNVSDHVDGRQFTKSDMEILEALSMIIAGMMKKLDAYQTVSLNFDRLKEAMKSILGMRENWGSRNLNNYTLIAMAVGERLGLDEKSMTALRMGMNMYDLGMMKIPRSIRVKKEELTEKERAKLRTHADHGFRLLSPMGLDERIMKMVRFHHEYFDGSGYPEGLAGAEIPIEARILNVIDSFRALITPAPYRRCFNIDEARNEILRKSGSNFDPKVVGAFVKSLHDLGARQDDADFVLDAVERELEKIRREHEKYESEDASNESECYVKEEVI